MWVYLELIVEGSLYWGIGGVFSILTEYVFIINKIGRSTPPGCAKKLP
jgi:hypothetical protein